MTFRLNDTVVETATSAKKMKMISSPKEGGLFFGGVPDLISDKVVKQDQSVTSEPFRGIIRDVYFDHR